MKPKGMRTAAGGALSFLLLLLCVGLGGTADPARRLPVTVRACSEKDGRKYCGPVGKWKKLRVR